MTKTLMLIPIDAQVDVQTISRGLNEFFTRNNFTAKIFTPIARENEKKSSGCCCCCQSMGSNEITLNTAYDFLADNQRNELLELIVDNFNQQCASASLPIIEGLVCHEGENYVADLNWQVAKALDATIIFVASNKNIQQLLKVNVNYYANEDGANLLGYISAHDEPTNIHGLPLLATMKNLTNNNLDAPQLLAFGNATDQRKITPPVFRNQLQQLAQRANKRIVLPEGNEPRTIKAAMMVAERNLARCVLLGEKEDILAVARQHEVLFDEKKVEIINPATIRNKYVNPLCELRKSKGMTVEQATEALQDNVMLGTMMLQLGEVDGLVSGAVHTTANTIRPALQIIKTKAGCSLVSSLFFMCLPEQVLVFADCAINPNPDENQLAEIAIQSADSAKAFGIEPRVAMLSYSTGASGEGADVDLVRKATEIARTKRPDLLIEGPLQYDAALVKSVGKSKAPNSKVAGQATVLIFPDLNTGNITYKAVQRTGNVVAIGPMLQGLRKPVNDLSRGCLVEDIIFTIALTAVQG